MPDSATPRAQSSRRPQQTIANYSAHPSKQSQNYSANPQTQLPTESCTTPHQTSPHNNLARRRSHPTSKTNSTACTPHTGRRTGNNATHNGAPYKKPHPQKHKQTNELYHAAVDRSRPTTQRTATHTGYAYAYRATHSARRSRVPPKEVAVSTLPSSHRTRECVSRSSQRIRVESSTLPATCPPPHTHRRAHTHTHTRTGHA